MEDIIIKDTHDFTEEQLKELFLSVNWSSGNYPEKLVTAMKNYKTVFSAWDDDDLVGLVCAMDDGIMTAYIHYLLLKPSHQKKGIGKLLINKMTEYYKDYLRIIVISYDTEIGFYEHCGFKRSDHSSPMFITELTT